MNDQQPYDNQPINFSTETPDPPVSATEGTGQPVSPASPSAFALESGNAREAGLSASADQIAAQSKPSALPHTLQPKSQHQPQMIEVIIDDEPVLLEQGATLEDALTLMHQKNKPYPILAGISQNSLISLSDRLVHQDVIRTADYRDVVGYQTYKRTAVFLLIKAFYSLVEQDQFDSLFLDFALGDGFYFRVKGDHFTLSQNLIDSLKERMQHYIDANRPISRRVVPVSEAIERFEAFGMHQKADLYRYHRTVDYVSLYRLGRYEDDFYGPLLSRTGLISLFDLQLYQDGFLLRIPHRSTPDLLPAFSDATLEKLFDNLQESVEWRERLGISSAAQLNEAISTGKAGELVLIAEAMQEKRISEIAQTILNDPQKRIILIAGPSSSGKTSFANRLCIQLKALGLKPLALSTDDYYIDNELAPLNPDGTKNFDCLEAMAVDDFCRDLDLLLKGEPVDLPKFNFKTGRREWHNQPVVLPEEGVLVVEGIFGLRPEMSYTIDESKKYRIYVSALGQINLDEHNYFRSTDGRLIRRLIRDNLTRNASATKTLETWASVRKGEEENIFPYQNNADVIFNTSTSYELAVLKSYAEALLYQVPKDSLCYPEASRLLRMLGFILGMDNDMIPNNSIVREFVGGSCFNV